MNASAHQPSLPGIDVGRIQLDSLLKKFPEPNTKAKAEAFFRKLERDKERDYCVATTITFKTDRDILRVVLKNKDGEQNDVKFELKIELPLDDQKKYDELYIGAAMDTYAQWLRLEKAKYR